MTKQEVIHEVVHEYTDFRTNMLNQDAIAVYDEAYKITVVKILMEHIVYDKYLDDFTDEELSILYNGANGKILNYLTNEYWTSAYSIDKCEDVTALIDYCIRQIRGLV